MTTVDYLRLATWDFKTYLDVVSAMRYYFSGDWKPHGWMQYRGQTSYEHSIFYGSGDQNNRKHFVLSVSGKKSREVFDFFMESPNPFKEIYCTRIDLQQTILNPKEIVLRKVYKNCPRQAKTWMESDTETIYIGARTSDTFTRLYEKLENKYLRLEHEFKGKKAKGIWAACRHLTKNRTHVLQSHFVTATGGCRMGTWVPLYFDLSLEIVGSPGYVPVEEEELAAAIQRKIKYLENTEIALTKYLQDHDLQPWTSQTIENLYKISRDTY